MLRQAHVTWQHARAASNRAYERSVGLILVLIARGIRPHWSMLSPSMRL